jgi:hypothetical protein
MRDNDNIILENLYTGIILKENDSYSKELFSSEKNKTISNEEKLILRAQRMASDGTTEEKTFSGPNSIQELKDWVDDWVGLDGDISDLNNIVSLDGYQRIHVQGLPVGGLSKILRADRFKFSQPELDYVGSLAETAMRLNHPRLLSVAKIKPDYDKTGREIGIHFRVGEGKFGDPHGKESRPRDWTMHFDVTYSGEIGKVRVILNIFNWDGTMEPTSRTVDMSWPGYEFDLTGERERDLEEIESVLIKYKPQIEQLERLLTKATLPNKYF